MKKMNITIFKRAALMLTLAILVMSLVGCEIDFGIIESLGVKEVPTDDEYTFTNPEPELAKTDAGFKIDGIADEEAYKNACDKIWDVYAFLCAEVDYNSADDEDDEEFICDDCKAKRCHK